MWEKIEPILPPRTGYNAAEEPPVMGVAKSTMKGKME
jgi:hypothetical protein